MRPRKRFGQHFLEPAWVAKVVDSVALQGADVVLEIGPGRGAMTLAMAPRVRRLIAVEIDRDLVARLDATVPDNVRIVSGDFLTMDVATVLAGEDAPVRVVGNLPYNVSSPILFKLLADHQGGQRISDATLMLQREVVDRLVAAPGSADYGVLAIQVAVHADVDRVLTLPPGAFRPPPKVTSAVVRMRFRPPAIAESQLPRFERMVRDVFTRRRKTLLNALKTATGRPAEDVRELLEREGIDPSRRPQTLTIGEFARLARQV